MKPNIFDFATTELSQDAFIAWLLQWASPECREYDAALCECAVAFTKQLLSLGVDAPETISTISVERQWLNIDVCAEVNGKYLIIIEDKIFTGQHSDQLERYQKSANEWCLQNGYQLVCIYLKTGSEASSTLKKVMDQGFAVLRRKDFLKLLMEAKVTNDIFMDFRGRLSAMENDENQYLNKKIGEWGPSDWKGFYQGLEPLRPLVSWGFVNNPAGGFWNAVLNWFDFDDYCPYMQIEEGPLCFKIGEVYENKAEVRNRFHEILMKGAQGNSDLERPGRFGNGTYMTVGVVSREKWLGGDAELVNMEQVVKRLNSYEDMLLNVIEEAARTTDV